MNLYTTYFASTKQESNDFTGAFGLGSKSPFSYTDSFTIESRHAGTNTIYSAHIDNTGSPNIAKMGDAPCGTETGITISFPVKPADFQSFKTRAQNIYQYFNPLPVILGSDPIKPLEVKKDFGSYAFVDWNYGQQPINLQMGNVCYPVSIVDIAALHLSNMRGILLRLKIGEVQVAASREKLQYDPISQERLRKALEEVLFDICREQEKLWDAHTASGTWEDICKFHELKKQVNSTYDLNLTTYNASGVKNPGTLYDACHESYFKLPPIKNVNTTFCEARIYKNALITRKEPNQIEFTKDLTLIYGPSTYSRGRIRRGFEDGVLTGRVLLVEPDRSVKGTAADVAATAAELQNVFKGIKEIRLDTLLAPLRAKSVRYKKGVLRPLPVHITGGVYITKIGKNSWGRNKAQHYVSDSKVLEAHEFNILAGHLGTLYPVVSFKIPLHLSRLETRKYQIKDRTDWMNYQMYMTGAITDQTNLDKLKAHYGIYKFKFQLNQYRVSNTGLLENLVNLKAYHQNIFSSIKPILIKHGIEQIVADVHSNSLAPNNQNQHKVYTAYKEVAKILDVNVVIPKFDEPMIKVDEKFKKASEIPWNMFIWMGNTTPKQLPKYLDEVMNEG